MVARVLLLLHAVGAVFLLGAVTHQALSVWAPVGARKGEDFSDSFRRVSAQRYAVPVAVLIAAMVAGGALIYPTFRVAVRYEYLDANVPWATGLFEIKEHWLGLTFGLLPAYLSLWRSAQSREEVSARNGLTLVLAAACWAAFALGQIINNVRGL